MQLEELKRIIAQQREELERKFAQEQIIPRAGLEQAQELLKYPNILAILGVRRAGKSFFSVMVARQLALPYGYINFFDERLIGFTAAELDKVLQAFYELYGQVELVILDEIQVVVGWELFASRLRETKRVIVTGSNAHLLSGELATHLTGRHLDRILLPFSLSELLSGKKFNVYLTEDRAKIKNELKAYGEGSGFPEFFKFGAPIIRSIYDDVLTKDCLKRYRIREEESFRELALQLVSNFACEFSYLKLKNITNIKDVHTVKNYVRYLRDAYLLFILERFSPKLKMQTIAPKKAYLVDQGIANFISFQGAKWEGRRFENMVALGLLRRYINEYNTKIYYWKSPENYEVDFVVRRLGKVEQLIQSCYQLDGETKKREFRALLKASQELQCSHLLVITNDEEGEETMEWFGQKAAITIMPLWKWLLGLTV